MWKHLLTCLTNGHLIPFLKVNSYCVAKVCPMKRKTIELFCSCRGPYKQGKSEEMAECEGCINWLHKSCESISNEVSQGDCSWKYSNCIK